LKVKSIFKSIIFLLGLSNSNFAISWVHQEISFYNGISDGSIIDLNEDGLMDILIISGRFIYIYIQKERGFNETPDDQIVLKKLGEFIDVGEVDPKSPGLEILSLSESELKYFYLDGKHYKESPSFLISQEIDKFIHHLNPIMSNFAFDINKDGIDEIFLLRDDQFFLYSLDNSGKFIGREISKPYEMTTVSLESKRWPSEVSENDNSDIGYFFRPEISTEKIALFQDFNFDGLLDLISQNMYIQNPSYHFEPENQAMINEISLYKKDKQEFFLDVDGDGKLDKILIEIMDIFSENMNIFPFAKISIFLNQNKNIFSLKPDYFFKTLLIGDKSPFVDINKDGFLDFISIWLEISPGSKENIIQVITESTLIFTVRCYIFKNQNGYSKMPNLLSKFKIRYDKLPDIGKYIPFDFSGDFNGDGLNDLLVRKEPEYIFLYLTDTEQKNFFSSGSRIEIPRDAEQIKVIDFNNDRKSDILLLNGNKMIILLSE
jgi:hypothetical protein